MLLFYGNARNDIKLFNEGIKILNGAKFRGLIYCFSKEYYLHQITLFTLAIN